MEHSKSHDKMTTNHSVRILKSKSPLEEQASRAFTPLAFKKFQEEFGRASLYSIVYMNGNEFVLRYYTESSEKNIIFFWDGQIARCSCKNFEFWGILHILRLFLQKDCYEIPSAYLPLRWCRDKESDISPSSQRTHSFGIENVMTSLAVEREDEVLCGLKSTTKGHPRKKRIRGGREIGKQAKSCSLCREVGHTAPTCPMKENIWVATSGVQKKNKTSTSDLGLSPIFCVKN